MRSRRRRLMTVISFGCIGIMLIISFFFGIQTQKRFSILANSAAGTLLTFDDSSFVAQNQKKGAEISSANMTTTTTTVDRTISSPPPGNKTLNATTPTPSQQQQTITTVGNDTFHRHRHPTPAQNTNSPTNPTTVTTTTTTTTTTILPLEGNNNRTTTKSTSNKMELETTTNLTILPIKEQQQRQQQQQYVMEPPAVQLAWNTTKNTVVSNVVGNRSSDFVIHPQNNTTTLLDPIAANHINSNTTVETPSQQSSLDFNHRRHGYNDWNRSILDTTNYIDCRLQLENILNPWISDWLLARVPLLEYIIEMDNDNDDDDGGAYYIVLFNIKHFSEHARQMRKWRKAQWYCDGTPATTINAHVDRRSTMIVVTCDVGGSGGGGGGGGGNHTNRIIHNITTTHQSKETGISPIYYAEPFLKCHELDPAPVMTTKTATATKPSSPTTTGNPTNNNKNNNNKTTTSFGLCTSMAGHAVRQLMPQWMAYHSLIGIDHFWIFVNEEWDYLTNLPNRSDVTYIPYNYQWWDDQHMVEAQGFYRLMMKNFWQTAAHYQCLYLMKKFKIDWVLLTDADEFLFLPDPEIRAAVSPLTALVDSIMTMETTSTKNTTTTTTTTDKIGGLQINSIPFGINRRVDGVNHRTNNNNNNTSHNIHYDISLDYTWRRNCNITDHPWSRQKHLLNVKNAMDHAVHWVLCCGEDRLLDQATQARLIHYKLPHKKVFGVGDENILQDTEFRDLYRERVVAAMRNNNNNHNST